MALLPEFPNLDGSPVRRAHDIIGKLILKPSRILGVDIYEVVLDFIYADAKTSAICFAKASV